MKICRSMIGLFLVGTFLSGATGVVRAQARIEIRPVETTTVTTKQFLVGDSNGRPTTLAMELRFPVTTDAKVPAVVLVHGAGGLRGFHSRWADELNSIGVAVVVLDSFTGRGIVSTGADRSQLDSLAMMVDAFHALGVLVQDARFDANRIAVMGFSKGAVAAVYSSNERFRRMWAPKGVQFAAHIGLYTPCYVPYHDDERLTGKPLRLFHGVADDYVPIDPCRNYVQRLQRAGADVTLTEFAGAHHVYDDFSRKNDPQPFQVVAATTARNCQLAEGDDGVIFNKVTGRPYDVVNDPCLEKGPHIAYNEAATVATVNAVKQFLTTVFKLRTAIAK